MRGYNIGELAAARRYVEAAAELRVPVLGQQLFAFAEYGSDLGSSGERLLCIAEGAMERYWIGPQRGAQPWTSCLSCLPRADLGHTASAAEVQATLQSAAGALCSSRCVPTTSYCVAAPSHPAAEVRGNPTEYYRRAGSGSSVGAGVRIGAVRAEAIRDNNSGKTNLWLSYGERF